MTDPKSAERPADFDARGFLQQLTTQPGVYRMLGAAGDLLYVGKARNLKKRVSQYFLRASGDPRIESMVSQIRHIDITVTHTEDEALILEATLIKELQPRYNILYRDDKSYPYLRISAHVYPRISYYRGESAATISTSGRFPAPARYAKPWSRCRSCSSCGPAATAFSRIANGPACSTRSNAARRPACS